MKIVEALKKIKDLLRKASDIRKKVHLYCCDMTYEDPVYGEDQAQQISSWMQAHKDIVQEIETLRVRIAYTNLFTEVTISLAGKDITKPITAWIQRKRDLNNEELLAWKALNDGNRRDQVTPATTAGEAAVELKVRRYYDVKLRDKMTEALLEERSIVDGKLEVVNAETDLMDR